MSGLSQDVNRIAEVLPIPSHSCRQRMNYRCQESLWNFRRIIISRETIPELPLVEVHTWVGLQRISTQNLQR